MSLHRTICGKCGYPSLARNGRTLCCGVTLDYESKVKIKIYKRKRTGSTVTAQRIDAHCVPSSISSRQLDSDIQLNLFGG